jgi:hypothetical protein
MIALMLSAWTMFGGDCNCEKLSEKLVACCRALGKPSAPDQVDWVEYYKRQGYRINGYPPYTGMVFVSPTLQWAVPNSCLNGPPVAPSGGPQMAYPQMGYPPPPGYGPAPGYPPPEN